MKQAYTPIRAKTCKTPLLIAVFDAFLCEILIVDAELNQRSEREYKS